MEIGVVAIIEHQYMLVPGLVLVLALATVQERPLFILLQVLVEILILVFVLVFAVAARFNISIGKSINTGSIPCNTISIDICISIRGCILKLKIFVHDLSISVDASINIRISIRINV